MDIEDDSYYFIGHYAPARSSITHFYELFTIEYLQNTVYWHKGWKNTKPSKKFNYKHTAMIKYPLLIDFSKAVITLQEVDIMQKSIQLKQRCCKSEVDDKEFMKCKSNQRKEDFIGMFSRYEKGILTEDDMQYISVAYANWFNEEWIKVIQQYRRKHLFTELRASTERMESALTRHATGEFKKVQTKVETMGDPFSMDIPTVVCTKLNTSTDHLGYLSVSHDVTFNGDIIIETYGQAIKHSCYDWYLVTPKERSKFIEDFMGRSVTSEELRELSVAFQKL